MVIQRLGLSFGGSLCETRSPAPRRAELNLIQPPTMASALGTDQPCLRVSSPAKHLLNFGHVHFLVANFLARKFFERNTPIFAQIEQLSIEIDAFALVYEQLLHDVVDRFVVSPSERRDAERHTTI
jgi:hypothetical protein